MERYQNNNILRTIVGRHSFISKISELLENGSPSDQLVVAVYFLEETNFLYCNKAFRKLLGAKVNQLLKGGWDFWFANVVPEENLKIKTRVRSFLSPPFDQKTLTLRYHILNSANRLICLKHEIVLHKLNNCTIALNYFFDISEKERIEHYLNGESRNGVNHNKKEVRPISRREEEVLKLIAEGFSSKQIADQLFISNHTAISHRKNLIEKFQVRNTAQLIKTASKVMEL